MGPSWYWDICSPLWVQANNLSSINLLHSKTKRVQESDSEEEKMDKKKRRRIKRPVSDSSDDEDEEEGEFSGLFVL